MLFSSSYAATLRNWTFLQSFNSKSELDNFVSENNYARRFSDKLSYGQKITYCCKFRQKFNCKAAIYAKFPKEPGLISVYLSENHCHELIEPEGAKNFPEKLAESVRQCLLDGYGSTDIHRHVNCEFQELKLSRIQISNLIQRTKRKLHAQIMAEYATLTNNPENLGVNLNDVINEVKRNGNYDLSEAPLLTILAKKPKLEYDSPNGGCTILDFSAKFYPDDTEIPIIEPEPVPDVSL